ncbi:hypothetical protein SAMN05216392_0357 [Streptococcus equinus]|uniref:Uncharacterized protein n=1 Tax=Streptococcus equinus TaxID=1335 RepID=A0A1H0Y1A8_STREI|nr:hypothetical protein [Streptococcus equinus]QBX24855.1 hypothetical protein Javan214_0018 [Streptococcus phage Javan214]SDQ08942.1 hypothetical protein SAMN05216392_0357 [Streptococcus equinus]
MIRINYYSQSGRKLASEVLDNGNLTTQLLALTCKKCILQGFYLYVAQDSLGNRIKEVVLEDELVLE